MNDHIELTMEEEDSHKTLFIYSDGSLSEKKGRRYSGFGVIGYNQGRKVFERREALGEHTKVFDAEMAGLHAASTKARWFIENKPTNRRPVKIVFYVDNTGAIHRIFKESPGLAQAHSRGFRWEICNLLNSNEEAKWPSSGAPGTRASSAMKRLTN